MSSDFAVKELTDTNLSGDDRLAFLRKAIKNDPVLSNPTDEVKAQVIEDLLQHRLTQMKGVRVSNVAVGKDVRHTVQLICNEVLPRLSIYFDSLNLFYRSIT